MSCTSAKTGCGGESLPAHPKSGHKVRLGRGITCDQARWPGITILNGIAGNESMGRIHRTPRQFPACRRPEVRLEVRTSRNRRGCLMLFQGPLLLGAVYQAQIIDAGIHLRSRARAHEIRNGDGGKEADDRHHDHYFHEGESPPLCSFLFHGSLSVPRCERDKGRIIITNVHVLPFAYRSTLFHVRISKGYAMRVFPWAGRKSVPISDRGVPLSQQSQRANLTRRGQVFAGRRGRRVARKSSICGSLKNS